MQRGAANREREPWLATPPPAPELAHGPEPARIGNVRIGTASWTERSLIASGAFYPPVANTPERRLRYYACHFPLVEVDSSYYALPARRNVAAWVERTPDDFAFGVKAYAALTEHPVDLVRLDRDLVAALPAKLRRARRVCPRDLPETVVAEIWSRFHAALAPLRDVGKLGYVLFQLPTWTPPSRVSRAYLESLPARLPDTPIAVEFRQALWMTPERAPRTLAFLRRAGLVYVSVDEPQGTPASIPPLAETTSDELAVVRFHGRRGDAWTKRGATTHERFGYLYDRDEIRAWVPRLKALARRTRDVHVLMNNCYRESAVRNAKDLAELLTSEG